MSLTADAVARILEKRYDYRAARVVLKTAIEKAGLKSEGPFDQDALDAIAAQVLAFGDRVDAVVAALKAAAASDKPAPDKPAPDKPAPKKEEPAAAAPAPTEAPAAEAAPQSEVAEETPDEGDSEQPTEEATPAKSSRRRGRKKPAAKASEG